VGYSRRTAITNYDYSVFIGIDAERPFPWNRLQATDGEWITFN